MRIISDFHDYYDGVQSLGQDRELVYLRRWTEVPETERRQYPEPAAPPRTREEWYPKKGNRVYGWPFWLAVAGKLYRGYDLIQHGAYPYTKDRAAAVYDPVSLGRFLDESGVVPVKRGGRWGARWEARQARDREEWLSRQGTEELREALATKGVVLASRRPGNVRKVNPLILNPRLAAFHFGQVMDAPTVYQEIAMWLGGVLPQRDAMTATVADPVRFEERGFDGKTSFRRPKGEDAVSLPPQGPPEAPEAREGLETGGIGPPPQPGEESPHPRPPAVALQGLEAVALGEVGELVEKGGENSGAGRGEVGNVHQDPRGLELQEGNAMDRRRLWAQWTLAFREAPLAAYTQWVRENGVTDGFRRWVAGAIRAGR